MVVGRVLSAWEKGVVSSQNKITWSVLFKFYNWRFLGGVCESKKQNGSDSRINHIVPFAIEA